MPSPLATDQHHNQLNHSEREKETGRQRNKERDTERKTESTKREREEAEKGGMLSAKAFIKTPQPIPLQGIDLICMLFLPLLILHS